MQFDPSYHPTPSEAQVAADAQARKAAADSAMELNQANSRIEELVQELAKVNISTCYKRRNSSVEVTAGL